MSEEVNDGMQNLAITAALAMTAARRRPEGKGGQSGSFEFEVMENTRYAMQMLREGSLPRMLLKSVRLIGTVSAVEFEESSQRFLIHFQCDGGEPETARTLRTDASYGGDIQRMVEGIQGKRCLIYKTNVPMSGADGERGRTVRVVPYIVPLS